jgi:DNA-binding NarL/FixJ family response regulator
MPAGAIYRRDVPGSNKPNQPSTSITAALVNDYDVVLAGLARMLDDYRHRVAVLELDANEPVKDPVDIVLYDNFAQPESDEAELDVLTDHPMARRIVVYTWNFHDDLVEAALAQGASGYISKQLSAPELVEALEAVHAGEIVVSDGKRRIQTAEELDWPGRKAGLSDREAEILALITQGKSNAEIARLTFLSPNTIKTYIRATYRKIGASSRTQAVLWGVEHGLRPDHRRIEHWRVQA